MSKHCLIYCRVSDPRQVTEGSSLEGQEEMLRDYAARNGFAVARVFVEPGESAKTAERTELLKLLAYAARHRRQIDALLIYKFNRLARYVEDHQRLRRYLAGLGIRIISISERTEDTPAGRLQENMLAAFAQFDNEDRAENCRNGMIRAVKEGRWVWPAPVGYRNVRYSGRANIEPEQPAAVLVARAFSLLGTGLYHPEEVRRRVETEGLRTGRGTPVSRTRFHVLIRNPVYMGVIEAFGLRAEGAFPPLVPPALFYKVQDVLNGKRRNIASRYNKQHPDFPLRGLVRCGDCETPYTASWSRGNGGRYALYRCRQCRGPGAYRKRDALHAEFEAYLQSFAFSPRVLDSLQLVLRLNAESRSAHRPAHRREVAKRLAQLQADRKTLVLKSLQGVYDDKLVKELLADFDRQIADLTEQQQELASETDVDAVLDTALPLLANLGEHWARADLEIKQRFQKLLFPEGVSYDGNGRFGTIPSSLLIRN